VEEPKQHITLLEWVVSWEMLKIPVQIERTEVDLGREKIKTAA